MLHPEKKSHKVKEQKSASFPADLNACGVMFTGGAGDVNG